MSAQTSILVRSILSNESIPKRSQPFDSHLRPNHTTQPHSITSAKLLYVPDNVKKDYEQQLASRSCVNVEAQRRWETIISSKAGTLRQLLRPERNLSWSIERLLQL